MHQHLRGLIEAYLRTNVDDALTEANKMVKSSTNMDERLAYEDVVVTLRQCKLALDQIVEARGR